MQVLQTLSCETEEMNLEPTENAKEIAKKDLGLTDDEIDSFWFRIGYAMAKKAQDIKPHGQGQHFSEEDEMKNLKGTHQHQVSLGGVCSHGSLPRSCYICELEAKCVELQQEINCLRMEPCQLPKCVAEIDKLKAELENIPSWFRNHQVIADRDLWKSKAEKLAEALRTVDQWFERMKSDQHEKLVLNQTLESASENWDKLLQEPLDMKPIKEVLAELEQIDIVKGKTFNHRDGMKELDEFEKGDWRGKVRDIMDKGSQTL